MTKTPPTSTPNKSDINLPWYRSFMVWFGIVLTLALIAGYSLLIYISHEQASHEPAGTSIKPSDELNQLFGVPFTRDQLAPAPQDHNNNTQATDSSQLP